MSWFKRGRNDSKASGQSSDDSVEARSRADTDPQTCLEVFQNHWKQALSIIKRGNGSSNSQVCSTDEQEAVLQNVEQMINLLVGEVGLDENGQGMPGPILHYLLEEDIFEQFCNWCHYNSMNGDKLKCEQLRIFEQLISQSQQLLLIHKAIIQPLLRLLYLCAEGSKTSDIESRLVLVLHQLCVCISQETVILESFFNASTNHGPTKFLIFSLLIPYLHREGKVGQQARDALLLIMTISARNPHIGLYIAENSDFCPVLATGLSGLYSSLPRKIPVYTDEWHQFSQEDISLVPELQMFLNSLEFCNAVTQVSHPAIRTQLIKFIYDGFLVPVLGPALHQDISGLPLPLVDSPMFSNSREEVIAATAYLDLFLRKTTEPNLLRTFLKFILMEQNDEIVILDSLITRINSSSKPLCVVSLSLFKTLVDLNCEDVMFQLVFRYLIPCTHVMVSQRRNVSDLDLHCKSAERFLSLRPNCCRAELIEKKGTPVQEKYNHSDANTSHRPKHGLSSFLRARKKEKDYQKQRSATVATEQPSTAFPPGTFGSKLEHYETNYYDYLEEARRQLESCAKACQRWAYPYDGQSPTMSALEDLVNQSDSRQMSSLTDTGLCNGGTSSLLTEDLSGSDGGSLFRSSEVDEVFISGSCQSSVPDLSYILRSYDSDSYKAHPENLKDFIQYLDEVATPPEMENSFEESLGSLDSVLRSFCSETDSSSLSNTSDSTPVTCTDSNQGDSNKAKCDGTTFEVINTKDGEGLEPFRGNSSQDTASYVEISMSNFVSEVNVQTALSSMPHRVSVNSVDMVTDRKSSRDESAVKSVSFNLTDSSMQNTTTVPAVSNVEKLAPNIGPFLMALFSKLDGMMQNSLPVNLLLTGLIARLASYPQPLLRSFLLSHNLVFQPTVKSLLQVLTSLKQKVDHFAYTVPNFDGLLLRAKRTLIAREEEWRLGCVTISPYRINTVSPIKPKPVAENNNKDKRKSSLAEFFSRRSPDKRANKKGPQLQVLQGAKGFRYINYQNKPHEISQNPMDAPKIRNAVFCAVILEEFVKELAAYSQEQAVLAHTEI
ncbi:FHF complex subunit HOOK-interacting protein 1B-like isoform X2 [Saccostrea echinata]|uniref:FHF complex subunit HOOK-interacting protein 1B-like isoform X2 n=1 Tax=Saccostrea echinata TaxID=191078 RepID=UPI002A81F4DC|nr:FHF complex subunit HOOK-interacting protein 1B-like isoform X2 [Saccostrea echinata]